MANTRRSGGVTKRCECRGADGKRLGDRCPQIARRTHGTYQVAQELPPGEDGKRRQWRRTGYDGAPKANTDLARVQAILDLGADDADHLERITLYLLGILRERADVPEPAEVAKKLGVGIPLDGKMTLADWLDQWLANKKTRPTTNHGYASHIRVHLKPRLGHIRLDRLTVGHVQAMFDAIADESDTIEAANRARREQELRTRWNKVGRPPAKERERLTAERDKLADMPPYRKTNGKSTRQAIRRTLRAALNKAIAQQLITFNPAAHVELDTAARPKGLLWTSERVERWRETGEKPSPVMVWTPEQLGAFLDEAEEHRLYSLYHVVAHHGLRRGEGVGTGWDNARLTARPPRLDILTEIVMDGSTPTETVPKTDSSMASVMIDRQTVVVLKERKALQRAERDEWNAKAAELRGRGEDAYDWIDTGKIWTSEDGSWLHPDVVSREFDRIVVRAGLPPINLRDLRHCAAALVKAGGGDLHDAKKKLRHSTIVLTSDTYMELFEEYEEGLTERAAAAVPRARKPRRDTAEHVPVEENDGQDGDDQDAEDAAA